MSHDLGRSSKRFKSIGSTQAANTLFKTAKSTVSHSRQKSARVNNKLSPKLTIISPTKNSNDVRTPCQLDLINSVKHNKVEQILYQSFRGESEISDENSKES